MKTLIITGGEFHRDFAVEFLSENKYDYVIAVDGGVAYAKELKLTPDLLVGDFDTFKGIDEYINNGTNVRRYIPEKDDTDTEIAIREAIAMGSDMDIICATGGRIDHLLANIHNLFIALEAGVSARIVDSGNVIFLKNRSFSMKREDYRGKYISFVPFSGDVTGLELKGFKYPLEGYTLKPGASRCISNEFAADTAYVEFDSGCLIVINSLDIKSK